MLRGNWIGIFLMLAMSLFSQQESHVDHALSEEDVCKQFIRQVLFEKSNAADSPNDAENDPGNGQQRAPVIKVGQSLPTLDSLFFRDAYTTVEKYVTCKLTAKQKAATVSFVYSIGSGYFRDSGLLDLLNKCKLKEDRDKIVEQFELWVYDQNSRSDGLYLQRRKEVKYFYEEMAK